MLWFATVLEKFSESHSIWIPSTCSSVNLSVKTSSILFNIILPEKKWKEIELNFISMYNWHIFPISYINLITSSIKYEGNHWKEQISVALHSWTGRNRFRENLVLLRTKTGQQTYRKFALGCKEEMRLWKDRQFTKQPCVLNIKE